MGEDKPPLTKEELSKRLERLSFRPRQPKITPEHWMYRERVAVRVEYGLSDLQPTHADSTPAEQEAIQKVLAASTVIHRRDGRAAWQLRHGVRRETLDRLAQHNRLRKTLDTNPSAYPSLLQDMLDSYIRGHAPPLAEQTLDQLEATLQVAEWLERCLPNLPSQDDIRRRMAHERLLKPFHFLVGTHFQGRAKELEELRQYVGVLSINGTSVAPQPRGDLEQDPPLMVDGPGGIGKSTLIAKFILEHAEIEDERRFPYVYIDFNRRDIDIQEPISILLEVARQIAIQYPLEEERWKHLYADWSARVEESSAGDDAQPAIKIEYSSRQEPLASARLREWNRYALEFNSAIFSILKPGQPFLVVLDTLEELLYHNLEYLEDLWNFLDNLKEAISSLRLVLSGRSPLPDRYPIRRLTLTGLDLQSAVALLLDLDIPDEASARQVIETTDRSPLSLRLAAKTYDRSAAHMVKKVGHYVTRPGNKLGDPSVTIPVAEDLLTVPGIPARESDVAFFSREYPLENMAIEESASAEWAREVRNSHSPEYRAFSEEHQKHMEPIVEWVKNSGDLEPTGVPTGEDVTELIRQKARELGYGEVGFTYNDRHYVYQSRKPTMKAGLPHAICLALEQDYNKTQTIPSMAGEETHFGTYFNQGPLTMMLTDFIRSLGYRVQVSGPTWHYGPMIPMFVQAGLGQLGANSQLLSPHFGSRARLQVIFTDANVTYDQPIDYGIHKFCQVCQVCVNRCPGRALMPEKVWYRGVEKNKQLFKRCLPVMARYLGCGICMKVCPIQKYGMPAVMEHYVKTGEVLGKGTDNLEGYTLHDKGYFGPGQLPILNREIFEMPQGRAEDWLLLEFRDKLQETAGDLNVNQDLMWTDFRARVEKSLHTQTTLGSSREDAFSHDLAR